MVQLSLPHRLCHLRCHRGPCSSRRWQGKVTLVPADMRQWQASEPADILVSELLGSFGDNELSPECLDGAMRFLKPGGISIPSAYTSFLHPVTTHKLWTDVAVRAGLDRRDVQVHAAGMPCRPGVPRESHASRRYKPLARLLIPIQVSNRVVDPVVHRFLTTAPHPT